LVGQTRSPDPLHRWVRRRGVGRSPHPRAVERRQPPHRPVPGDEDRADLVPAHDDRGRRPLRRTDDRLQVPGPTWPDAVALLPQLRGPGGLMADPMLRFDGKVVFVAGIGSIGPGWGNGKASAVLFARQGATVFGVDLDLAAAEETARVVQDE